MGLAGQAVFTQHHVQLNGYGGATFRLHKDYFFN